VTSTSSWDLPLRTRLFALALARQRPPIARLTPAEIPDARAWKRPARRPYTWVTGPVYPDVEVADTSFPARDGVAVPLRLYRPTLPGAGSSMPVPDPAPVLMWFHGGGWVLGNLDGYDPICSWLAHEAQVLVVSVDYRLAPEHPAPRAAEDCVDAVRWVASHGPGLGAAPEGMGVAGDSAGGNLAAVASQVVRDEGGARIGYQALIYPATDATMSMPSVRLHAHAPILTRADMDAFIGHYLGADGGGLAADDPLVSPLHAADHHGLPPTLIQTADLDPLRDEGLAYAEQLQTSGVPVQATNYPRAPHGFHSFPGATAVGRAARSELARWVALHSRERRVD
jgi:acetyl esterase